jgi:DNA-binding LytR/AlgR family response regulator
MNCIIVDDEPQARKMLHTYLSDIPGCRVIRLCSNAMEAYEALHNSHIDLAFLDIKMPGLSGIDFLKSLAKPPLVILTTAFNRYAMDGYDLDVVDYLLKPISLSRLLQAVNKANERIKNNSTSFLADSKYFFVKENGDFCKILYEDVIYFEGMQNYVRLHMKDSKVMIVSGTMKSIEAALPANDFVRIHKSYIISFSAIQFVRGNSIQIQTGTLPIGLNYKENLMKSINNKKII